MEKLMIMYLKELLPYEPNKKRIENIKDLQDAIFTTSFISVIELCLTEGVALNVLLDCANKAIEEKYPEAAA